MLFINCSNDKNKKSAKRKFTLIAVSLLFIVLSSCINSTKNSSSRHKLKPIPLYVEKGNPQLTYAQKHNISPLSVENIQFHLKNIVLSGGRGAGSDSEKKAAIYLSQQLHNIQLSPWLSEHTYSQPFLMQFKRHGTLTAYNVMAHIKGSTSLPAIIIGAHFDHLGQNSKNKSLASIDESNKTHPGADDNASGVDGLLAVAEYLKDLNQKEKFLPKRDVVFAFWSAEELGLLGSNFYVSSYGQENVSPYIMANINLDMIGRLEEHAYIQGLGSAQQWNTILEGVKFPEDLNVVFQDKVDLPIDAMSFYHFGVPFISLFTGIHEQYHSPRDIIELINFPGILKISALVAEITMSLSNLTESLTYVADKSSRK